ATTLLSAGAGRMLSRSEKGAGQAN
ncbi:RNA ligase RtcB family protein, partial [Escherichia coli]|nr:RNA ligase RtcB family protein [Escherichia coli]